MADESQEKQNNSKDEIKRVALERFKLAEEAYAESRDLALKDLKFGAGDQWPADMKATRKHEGRPCFTINRMPQHIRQVTNDQRQNRPSIKVSPVDDHADVETAKILQGIIRHIEYDSNADVAYDTGFDGAVRQGFGYLRILTEYVSPRSFEQQIKIKSIRNAFSVYLDPAHKEPDGSDANWGFIFEDVPKDQFKAEYKNAEICQSADWRSYGDEAPGWVSDTTVRVAEYFYKDYQEIDIVLLSDGVVIEKSKLDELFPDGVLPEGLEIKAERTSIEPVVKWCKFNGYEILEETDWLGKWIPIIPVYGDILDINGKVVFESLIRHAKDAQFLYNLWRTTEAEAIGLAPKAPWVIAEGQITEENEHIWETANSKAHAYLPYKPTSIGGTVIGAPQRNAYEPPVQAITGAGMQASEDIKSTTGQYDAALGARSNEVSGKAIERRTAQAQTSNFHFTDNLTRSIRHTGRQLIDLIPKVYDTARTIRIIGEEGDEQIVKINQVFEEKGQQKNFDLGLGKYDVAVETGPSFATKRQEAVTSMLDLSRTAPQLMQAAGDLMVKNMDWPGATEIAERLKKTLPPGLAEDDKNAPPIPPQIQAQMQAMSQQLEQLTQVANEQAEIIKTKTLELESKERIELAKLENAIALKQMDLAPQESMNIIAHELAEIHARLEMVGINRPINADFNEASEPAEPQFQEQQPTGGLSPGNYMGDVP